MCRSLITHTYPVLGAFLSVLLLSNIDFFSSLILPSTANFLPSLSSTSLLKSCSIGLFQICWVLTEFIFLLLRSFIEFCLTYSPTFYGCINPALTGLVSFFTHSFIPNFVKTWDLAHSRHSVNQLVHAVQTLTVLGTIPRLYPHRRLSCWHNIPFLPLPTSLQCQARPFPMLSSGPAKGKWYSRLQGLWWPAFLHGATVV